MLQNQFPNIISFINFRSVFDTIPVGREMDALIDMFICLESEKFIGIGFSTFSTTIKKIRDNKGLHCSIISHVKNF